jgi:D-alanine-D-alanine ligase
MRLGLLYEIRPETSAPGLPADIYQEMEAIEAIQTLTLRFEGLGHTVHLLNAREDAWRSVAERRNDLDLIYNYSVGFGCRSREVHAATVCESLGIPYTGSDPLALALASNKYVSKLIARAVGVRTPRFRLVREPGGRFSVPAAWSHCIVKPVGEGSSIGTTGPLSTAAPDAVRDVARRTSAAYAQSVLVEEFVAGFEVTVPVLGTDCPRALPPVALLLDGDPHLGMRTFDGRLKLETDSVAWSAEIPLPPATLGTLRNWAVRMHTQLGCSDVSRSDFRVTAAGVPYFLEINATPQMTPEGGAFHRAGEAEGMSFDDVLRRILESATERRPATPRTIVR